jgi:hypothetical protein
VNHFKAKAEEIDAAEAVQKIIALVQANRSVEGLELLRRLAPLEPKVEQFNLLKALFLQNSVANFCSQQAALTELELFPGNESARIFLQELESARQARIAELATVPKDILISLVLIAEHDFRATLTAVKAALYQIYPTLEIVVVQRESDISLKQALLNLDPRVRVLELFGANFWQALEYGLQSSEGEYQMVIPDSSVVFADTGLHTLAYIIHHAKHFEFLVGQRSYLDGPGIPTPMRSEYLQFNRALFLDEDNFTPPSAVMHCTHTVWSKKIFKQVGNRLATDLKEAADFELFLRIFRETKLITVPLPLAIGRVAMEGESAKHSVRYISEALSLIRKEKRQWPLSDSDHEPGLKVTLHSTSNPLPSAGQSPVKAPRLLSAQYTQLLNMSGPTISLVMPSLNQAIFLEQALDSILSQGYPHLELIIIDGGSTDHSLEIIKKYERYLKHWCSEKDEGQYFAIQKGFDLSSGEVMGWLNSDDKLAPRALSWLGLIFLAFPQIRWVTGCAGTIHESGLEDSAQRPKQYSRESYLMRGFDNPFIQQEGTFWRRSLWQDAGGALDLRYSLAADMELWRRFFRFSQLCSVDFALGLFRVQPQQRSQLSRMQYYREAENVSREEIYLVQQGIYPEMLPALEPLTEDVILQQIRV